MQLTSQFRHISRGVSPALLLLFFLLSIILSNSTLAAQQNTAFLPLRINASDRLDLQRQADKVLAKELGAKNFTMIPRDEAEALVDYSGTWPPPAKTLSRIADKTGYDYVAVGSLTKVGKGIELDVTVFDVLNPGAPEGFFQEISLTGALNTITRDAVKDILGYSNRNFIISSIAPAGNKRIDSGAILRKITTKPGDFYDAAALRQDLKSVFSMGYFDDVAIDVTDSPTGKTVTFVVKEKPLIKTVSFIGSDAISEDDVREAANIAPNTIVNPNKINNAVQRIKGLYKSKGYFNTKVAANLSYPTKDTADVQFKIQEGKKISIKGISFQGNSAYDDDDLEDVIQTGTWNWLSWLTESGVLKMDVLQQDAGRLAAFYHNNGFIEAKVGEPKVEEKNDALYITFPVEEGPRYRVGTVDIEGDLIEDKTKLISMLAIRKEKFLNRKILRDDTLKLTDLYAEHGYAFAEINPKVNKSKVGKRVDITLKVDKGSLVYFNRVEIRGNTRTRDNVIRRDLTVKEGGIFDSKAIRTSTRKLQRLDFFEDATVTPQPTMDEDKMNVIVEVKEKSTGQFSIGAGYSSSESVLFMGEISENNLLGTGNRLSLSVNLSGITTRFNLSYTNPRFLDSNVSAGIDLFNWKREYDDYTKDSVGGGLRFGHPFFEKWYIYYGYSLDNTTLSDVAENASQIIKDSEDINLTSAIHVRFLRDTLNRRFVPDSGSRNALIVRHAGGWLGGDADFTKLEGTSSWYFPMFWKSIFHIKGAIGQVFASDKKKLPVYERFYLGGMNSIRGFSSTSISPVDPVTNEKIGGDKMWYTNIAVQFPLVEEAGLHGEVFTDLGNVYAVDDSWDFGDFKKTAGVGFMWMSPMGPIRLAWGYNLDKKDGEDSSNWDFTMGGSF
jgi:outer membrane protein insertion porin family